MFTNIDIIYLQVALLSYMALSAHFTYSVAIENGMPMNVGLKVSVYISIPVPLR